MRTQSSKTHVRRAVANLRRAARAAAPLALCTLVIGGGLAAAPPARAAEPLSLHVVGGDEQLSAAWTAVAGAASYDVRWGIGNRLDRRISTTGTSIRIPHVANLRVYSVQVSAHGIDATSARETVRPVPYVPTPIGHVTAVPDGTNRIRVSWTGGGQARSVAVLAGADSMMRASRFSTAWMPAAVRSAILTVPSALRSTIGAGSGNVVFVKVVQSNAAAADPAKGLVFSLRDKYRLTPSGTWTLAGDVIPTAPVTRLTVASWNVQSVSASADFSSADQWAAREPKVVANIEHVAPDVIGLQELTTARLDPACLNPPGKLSCVEQYQSLAASLASAATPYLPVRSDADAWVYTQKNAYVDSALFYDPAKLTVDRSGFLSPRALLGSRWPSSLSDEAGVWAELSTIPSGDAPSRSFIVASIHLPAGDHTAVRAMEAVAVGDYLDVQAKESDGSSLPVVLTGDFNDNGASTPGAASLQLLARGWFDSAATLDRSGIRYSTSNGTNGSDGPNPGYPVHAAIHPYATSRIDYILLKGSPFTYRYQNLVELVAGDRFDPRYQGSDHDMQVASIGIADPTTSP